MPETSERARLLKLVDVAFSKEELSYWAGETAFQPALASMEISEDLEALCELGEKLLRQKEFPRK